MPSYDWFSPLKPSEVPEHLSSFIEEFVEMLDEYRPTKLVPERSYLRRSDGGIELRLAHAEENEADILIVVADDEATVVWASTHEHVWPHESSPEDDRPWTSLIVDLVARILRSEVVIETVLRDDTWVKTRTIFVDQEGSEDVFSVSLSLWGWIIWWRPHRVIRHRFDYGVRRSGGEQ